MPELLLIRADASPKIGTGHVMRSLALAQGWQRRGGRVLFLQADTTPALDRRLRDERMELRRFDAVPGSPQDAEFTVRMAREQDAAWVAADGYRFGATWQKAVKDSGFRLLLWDDYGHAEHYCADFVLNQNLHADAKLYANRDSQTRLLLGTRYVQLRREFLEWRDWQRTIPQVASKILVTMGGSDPDNVTGRIVEALAMLPDLEATLIVGGSNPHLELLQSSLVAKAPAARLVVNANNMPELMANADIALTACGTTSWELAFMGLPSIGLVLADNQAGVAAALERENLIRSPGRSCQPDIGQIATEIDSLRISSECRCEMSRRGREIVDGMGVERVVTYLHALPFGLRRACEMDCRLIWEWANEPGARMASFSSEPIPWEDHRRWFAARVNAPECFFYIASDREGNPLGQIRFDLSSNEGVVSVSLAPAARGKGRGAALIARGAEQFFNESHAAVVHAYIKPENLPSCRAFESADFAAAGTAVMRGHPALHYLLRRKAV